MDALDFGCGTGLLTLRLQPLVRSITGMNSLPAILEVLKDKIAKPGLTNVRLQFCDLEHQALPDGSYHLITSSMTLHHIRETAPLLAWFFRVPHSGGTLCLADLDSEDGRFHADNTGVFHFGFDRTALRSQLELAGFADIRDVTAAEIEKPGSAGVSRRLTAFVITALKR